MRIQKGQQLILITCPQHSELPCKKELEVLLNAVTAPLEENIIHSGIDLIDVHTELEDEIKQLKFLQREYEMVSKGFKGLIILKLFDFHIELLI